MYSGNAHSQRLEYRVVIVPAGYHNNGQLLRFRRRRILSDPTEKFRAVEERHEVADYQRIWYAAPQVSPDITAVTRCLDVEPGGLEPILQQLQ